MLEDLNAVVKHHFYFNVAEFDLLLHFLYFKNQVSDLGLIIFYCVLLDQYVHLLDLSTKT